MATEYNPSFEDMYPVNDDALFEDFRDALVIFIDRIKNLCNNVISNSAFSELSIAHTHLCKLGMPSEKVMGKRQIRAWKNLLIEIEPLDFMYFFDKENEMNGQLQIGTSESGDIICETEKGDIPDSWHEDKNKLTQFLAEKLEKLEIYREMIESRQSNVQADPDRKTGCKMTKNISDVIKDIGNKAEAFLGKQDVFKKKLDPIFDEIREFEQKILEHIEGMPKTNRELERKKLIATMSDKDRADPQKQVELKEALKKINRKYQREKIPELLTWSEKPPKEGYIWVSNHCGGVHAPHFLTYYPEEKYGNFVGWIPESLFKNEPISTLSSLAWGNPQPQNIDLLAYQYAIIAILHDAPRIGQSCQTLYFDLSGEDVASRVAFEFVRLARFCANERHISLSNVKTTIITRFYNALKSVELDLGKVADMGQEDSKSNMSGMTWQEAQKKAETLVDEKGYLGFQKLAKAVG